MDPQTADSKPYSLINLGRFPVIIAKAIQQNSINMLILVPLLAIFDTLPLLVTAPLNLFSVLLVIRIIEPYLSSLFPQKIHLKQWCQF